MDFLSLVKKRRSCRAFLPDPIDEQSLNAIVQAAQLAPSACNLQPFKLHILTGAALEKARACAWLYQAPVAILVCTEDEKGWVRRHDGENFALADAAIAVDHMALMAASLDISSCIIGAIKLDPLVCALQLPDNEHPQLILALGKADASAEDKVKLHDKRKSLEELVIRQA